VVRGVAVGDALADPVAEAVGAGLPPPPSQAAALTVQPDGWPAAADGDAVTNPTVTEPPGWSVASQSSLLTITRPRAPWCRRRCPPRLAS
jgi:hypothetical protein